ncbi:TPA: hypothetical protein ACSZA9_12840 [Listeria monocytogenes]|nr:hypothetical protein [Listeria monocytogenes]
MKKKDKPTSSKNIVPYHHESLPASIESEFGHMNRNIYEKVRAKMYDRKIFFVTQHFEYRDGKKVLVTQHLN